jgi:hypothetical protein
MNYKDAFFRWLEIREANGIFLTTSEQLKIDADHSSLLSRLVGDGDVFPEAPPRSYSYPWCDLIRIGKAFPFEVSIGPDLIAGPDALVIEQCAEWRVLERLGGESVIASYLVVDQKELLKIRNDYRAYQALRRNEIDVPKRLSESRWRVYVDGVMEKAPERKRWVVERIQ